MDIIRMSMRRNLSTATIDTFENDWGGNGNETDDIIDKIVAIVIRN